MPEISTLLLIIVLIIILAIVYSSILIMKEYERAVFFRLGRLIGAKGPGLVFRIPIIDTVKKVDLRVVAFDIPKQRVITKDNVTVDVDAVVYYRVFDPSKAVTSVEDYMHATNMLSQTTLRDVLGQVELDELLTKREELGKRLTSILDSYTDPWGVKVVSVSIKDVALPEGMQRALAKQAEAERERRARIIVADGEYQAATKMIEAATMYSKVPIAMRLRELQTLTEIAREKNLIVVTTPATVHSGEMLALMQAAQRRLSEKKTE